MEKSYAYWSETDDGITALGTVEYCKLVHRKCRCSGEREYCDYPDDLDGEVE